MLIRGLFRLKQASEQLTGRLLTSTRPYSIGNSASDAIRSKPLTSGLKLQVAKEAIPSVTPMSADYDQNSSLQLGANMRNLPLLTEALSATDSHGDVINVADFGSATGLNSMKTFSQAFTKFRETSDTQISVHHVDLPNNDWSMLFKNAVNSPHSYLTIKGTFVETVGRCNYVRVFPDNFLSIAFSIFSLHWLSRPVETPNQLKRYLANPKEVQHEASVIAEEDLDLFLAYRTLELKVGGRMILHTPAHSSFILPFLYRALLSMCTDGLIPPKIIENVQYTRYYRSEKDFQRAVSKLSTQLRIISIDTHEDKNVAYQKYLKNNNKEEYIYSVRATGRASTENSMRKVLELQDGASPLLDELYKRFGNLIGEDIQPRFPQQLHVVIEKTA